MPTIHTGSSDIRLGPGEEVDVMACRDACTTDFPVSEPLASTNSLLSDPDMVASSETNISRERGPMDSWSTPW
jgi:hypothetical protein